MKNNENINQALEDLFQFVPPHELRQSVHKVFFSWLIENPVPPDNLKKITEDFYFLLSFLEAVENENKAGF